MNLDENTKWIIEKTIVVGVAVLGLLGSGKFFTSQEEKEDEDIPDWPALVSEQRAMLIDLKEHLDELEDSAARKDRFIVQLLHDCQAYQRTINTLERDLNRPITQWEINITDSKSETAA